MKKVLSLICILLLLLELFFIEKMRIETPMLTESRIHPNQTAAEVTPAPELLPAAAVTTRPAESPPPRQRRSPRQSRRRSSSSPALATARSGPTTTISTTRLALPA